MTKSTLLSELGYREQDINEEDDEQTEEDNRKNILKMKKSQCTKYPSNQNYIKILEIVFILFLIFGVLYCDFKIQDKINDTILKTFLVFIIGKNVKF